jgi:hypothetical protein
MGLSDLFDGDGDLPDKPENTTTDAETDVEAVVEQPAAPSAPLPEIVETDDDYDDDDDDDDDYGDAGETPLIEFTLSLRSEDPRFLARTDAVAAAVADGVMTFASVYGPGEIGTVIVDENGVSIPITAPSDAEAAGFTAQAAACGTLYVGALCDIPVVTTISMPGSQDGGVEAGWENAVARTAGQDDVSTVRALYCLNGGPLTDAQTETVAAGSMEFLHSQQFAEVRVSAVEHRDGYGTVVTFERVGDDNPARPLRLFRPELVTPTGARRFPFGTVTSYMLP